MWPALFAEARANGLNTIESYQGRVCCLPRWSSHPLGEGETRPWYVFWNYHARTRDGAYDYTGAGNVTHFLRLAQH
eukprot:gene138-23165_t